MMKLFAVAAAALVAAAAPADAQGAVPNAAVQAHGVALASTGPIATYVPESDPWDNAATDTKMIPTIPVSPQCTVRGQTVFEIRKMRADAKQIGMAIMYEIQTMEKRKTYIEQMTQYLNDRIRELNKVKHDLAAEQKWIDVSNQRIAELAQKEKLIKLQDVMTCIKDEQDRLQNERGTKQFTVAHLEREALALKQNIDGIRRSMDERLADRQVDTTSLVHSSTHHQQGQAGTQGSMTGEVGEEKF